MIIQNWFAALIYSMILELGQLRKKLKNKKKTEHNRVDRLECFRTAEKGEEI